MYLNSMKFYSRGHTCQLSRFSRDSPDLTSSKIQIPISRSGLSKYPEIPILKKSNPFYDNKSRFPSKILNPALLVYANQSKSGIMTAIAVYLYHVYRVCGYIGMCELV